VSLLLRFLAISGHKGTLEVILVLDPDITITFHLWVFKQTENNDNPKNTPTLLFPMIHFNDSNVTSIHLYSQRVQRT